MNNLTFYTEHAGEVPEFIYLVFPKTSPKRSFSVIQNGRFGLGFAKSGSIISDTVNLSFAVYLDCGSGGRGTLAGK